MGLGLREALLMVTATAPPAASHHPTQQWKDSKNESFYQLGSVLEYVCSLRVWLQCIDRLVPETS